MAYEASSEDRVREGPPPGGRDGDRRRGRAANERNTGLYWLFLIPMFGTLLPWIYNRSSPELFGMPFFYWYQMAWVPISVIITVFVYIKTKGTS